MRKIETTAHRTASQCVSRRASIVVLLGIVCLLFPAKASAQSGNRWLFIFNTSSAMRDRAQGVDRVTQDLLGTAMHGNLHAGDTIGIWTYDNQLRADEAPLQTWSPETSASITRDTLTFVSRHPYGKTAAFDDVLANMLRVIKISDSITVILVSDGNDPVVTGTPFDARVTAFYRTNYNQQRKQHMPIVTVFRGEHGRITTNTLSLAPWPVEIPFVPAAPKVVARKVAEAPKAPVTPSLIMVGHKEESVTKLPANLPDITQRLEQPPTPAPAPAAAAPIAAPQPAPEPAPAPAATAVETKPAAPAASVQSETQPTPQPEPKPAVVAETSKAVEPAGPAASTVDRDNATVVLARESGNATESDPSATSASASQAVAHPAQPAAEASAAEPAMDLFSARNIAIVSVAFSILVSVLLIMVARNARRATRVSLITRSLDREAK